MRRNLFNFIKDILSKYIHSRVAILTTLVSIFTVILIGRVFYLQIIRGESYQNDYTVKISKTETISATRGSIYDRNGNLLAYDKLAYAVTFEDTGDYDTDEEMNEQIATIISLVEESGDEVDDQDFDIDYSDGTYSFNVSGSTLDRWKADVYGHTYITDLSSEEADATAEEMVKEFMDDYGIFCSLNESEAESGDAVYDDELAFKIMVVRYAMAQNSYSKYIETTIASDVSEETVAVIEENSADIMGLEISEETIRVYNDSEYFAHLIGYTGLVSEDELEELKEERSDYTSTDSVGKSGIEEYCETYLQGTKGSQEIYVDNVGTVLEVTDTTDPVAGDDVYLTIDSELQIAVYDLLEEELASILYSKISNIDDYEITSETSASDIVIPIKDVYYALIENSVIDITTLGDSDSGENEQEIYAAFDSYNASVIEELKEELTSSSATAFEDCDDELQEYENFIMDFLYENEVVDQDAVDTSSDEYTAWSKGTGSLKDYLEYNISENNIDTSVFEIEDKYANREEIYSALVTYVENELLTNQDFQKLIYKYMIDNDKISGYQVCMVLYEQGILDTDDDDYADFKDGNTSAYTFIKNKIKNLEITPAQLALDPCNASCVIVDPNDGEVLACVTYPGYDNNKMANSVDSDYYESLTNDLSYPLLNYATQQKTAPGSTFKMVTATAALTEGYLSSADEEIEDEGEFEKISPSPSCWIYPSSTHGSINVSEAIRDSCNYFFYELGYRMSTANETTSYNDETGLSILSEYASAYGLDSTTGIEISESSPEISDEDAVRSAIGQGSNNYTTSQLARYVATVANSGTCYNLSLISKIVDTDGNVIEEFASSVYNELTQVSSSTWSAIHKGMKMVVEELDVFDDFDIVVAGKTGTAQETSTRPNHALFVCYAPYSSPEIAVATRIPYGYTSANAAEVTSYILKYYFDVSDLEEITEELQDAGGTTYVDD